MKTKAKYRRIRERSPKDSPRRFLTQKDLAEIRWGCSCANRRAKQDGKTPFGPKIVIFSCRCNCFYIDVE